MNVIFMVELCIKKLLNLLFPAAAPPRIAVLTSSSAAIMCRDENENLWLRKNKKCKI